MLVSGIADLGSTVVSEETHACELAAGEYAHILLLRVGSPRLQRHPTAVLPRMRSKLLSVLKGCSNEMLCKHASLHPVEIHTVKQIFWGSK